jgi:hypothetical protein
VRLEIPVTQSALRARLVTSPVWPAAGAAVISVLVGTALVAKPTLVTLLLVLALAGLGVAVAVNHPSIAFGGLIGITAFLPSYAGPSIGPLLVIPGAAAAWVVAISLGWRNLLLHGRVFRPNAVDACVALFVVLMAISIAFSPRTSRNEYIHVMFLWVGPYLGARILLADIDNPLRVAALSCGIATAILAPIAFAEYLGAANPFHNLNFNSGEYAVWAEQSARYGSARASASFGHPIALSMFGAVSALLSVASALNAEGSRERKLWYLSAALALSIQIFTVSRTGWLMIFVGLLGIVLFFATGPRRRRLLTLIGSLGVAVILLLVVAPSALQAVPGFEKSEARVAGSSEYREALLSRALEPGVLNAWGNAQNEVTPYVSGSTATDNAYIILADMWGLIPTAALLLLALALLSVAARNFGGDPDGLVAFPIVAFSGMVALFVVAFITQQQVMIWMMVGTAGVAAERLGARRREAPQGAFAPDRM